MGHPDDPTTDYRPEVIEPKWQRIWEESAAFKAVRRPGRRKAYILDMFPYPSGSGLHVGHPEGYTATDIVARYRRMKGYDVLHPMGWDAFGLPAEQHAIATGTHPRTTTQQNIASFKRQMKMLGLSYDWSREIDTTDPAYVRWTQWIFLQLFNRGLAYQDEVPVNWCPALGTVLANEEVIDGKSERGGHPVVRLPLRQWMLRITSYADALDEGLASLDWPDTKAKQRFWIGRSEGAEVEFPTEDGGRAVRVFTTRVDTLPGATYVVVAPEHPLVSALTSPAQRAGVEAYVAAARAKSEIDRTDTTKAKTGIALGTHVINPINGQRLPLWVADYVIGTYGTGAVMAVPAHDERDHEFARNHGLPIVGVVAPSDGSAVDVTAAAYTADGVSRIPPALLRGIALADGTPSADARRAITDWLSARGRGAARVTYRLRDWVFSRQRYWGEPIPIYFPVRSDGDPRRPSAQVEIMYDHPIAVDERELPLALPELEDFRPGEDPAGPLARIPEWRFFQKDGQWYARETNTMPQWAGSCWYYLRFLTPRSTDHAWTAEAYRQWMPVDLYVGGSEHAVLHLLYARFWHKVLFDAGLVADPEPFLKLVHQGMILGENGEKMSKSRGNVVNPDDVVARYGADTFRVYEMFMGPLEAVKPWNTNGMEGVRRFLDRVWRLGAGSITDDPAALDDQTRRLVHKTVKKVTDGIEALRLNTAIAQMMVLAKHLAALPAVPREAFRTLVLVLSPFAPHLGEELWERLGAEASLVEEPWPAYDPDLTRDEVVEVGIQVNGKLRGVAQLAVDADEDAALAIALEDTKVRAHVQGRPLKKIVYRPGRIINLIV